MFQEADQRTSFDLNFSLFRIPVRVHPFFWILSALLGWFWFTELGFGYLILWIACCFLSILIHEMGHVLMGRLFGHSGHILLYSFGGLAIGCTGLENKRWQRIAVSLAGPGMQLLLFAVVVLVQHSLSTPLLFDPTWGLPIRATLLMLWWINLVWALVNLLPIWPLDGGQIMREIMEGIRPRDGVVISLAISAVLSGVLCIHQFLAPQGRPLPFLEWMPGSYYNGLVCLLLCVTSLQLIQAENARRKRTYYDDERFPWE